MKKNILIVDDDYFIRSLLFLLLKENYNVVTAENGLEAILWLDNNILPDLIITDVDMPEIDGFHLIELLKKSGYYREIPTMVLTGHDDPAIVDQFKDSGAIKFITKPFNPPELLECLFDLLHEKEELAY